MYLLSAILISATCLFCVISTQVSFLHDHMTPSLVGLALSLVLDVSIPTQL